MFIDVNYNKRPQEARLHLAKPNNVIVSSIWEKFRDSLSLKLGNINELSFSIPYMIEDESLGEQIQNPHVDSIKEKMLVRVKMGAYKEWFVVDGIEEDADDADIFNVTAFSLGYELKGKRVSGFVTEGMTATEMGNYLLQDSVWSIGTVDIMFDSSVRSFDSGEDSNILDCIIQWAETFGGLLVWDTDNREISLKNAMEENQFRGLSVGYGRFLRSVKRSRTTDEMVTRLWVEGAEGLTINSVNPTGQGYIEDFTYFMHPFSRDVNKNVIQSSFFMSDELCHAILDHKILLEANAPEIRTVTEEISAKQLDVITQQTKLTQLQSELNTVQQLLDMALSTGDTTLESQRRTERNAKASEVESQGIITSQAEQDLEDLQSQLQTLQDEISNQASFTPELLQELNLYIIESVWRDDRYIDAEELYDDAVSKFNEIREPKVIIEIGMDNLMNIIEEQYYWDKLILGELIKVKYPQMNIEYMAKIIEINYDLENNEASLVIANTKDLLSETEKLVQLLYSSSSASTLVQNNKYKWNKVNALQKEISQILTNEWDATKNKIIAGVNNSVEIGNRGIIIENPDFPDEIIIIQSGVIALSKDRGETWKTAIKPDGIVAERLIGQIIAGQELLITNSTGTFTMDNNGAIFDVDSFIIRSSSGSGNLVDRWQGTGDFVDEYKDDNLITAYEKKMLKIKWEEIAKRYTANDTKLTNYYEDAGVSLQFVNDYHYRYDELYAYLFVTVHGDAPMLAETNMAYTTRVVNTEFDSVFRNYDSTLVELEKQLAIKANSMAQQAIQDAKDANDLANEVMDDVVYKIELHSSMGWVFKNGQINTVITAKVYRGKDDITSTIPISGFIWKKYNKDGVLDVDWNNLHVNVGKQITITREEVDQKAIFQCDIDIVS